MTQKKILILGAGVIGSIYAGRLASAGNRVTILARNTRLNELQKKGLSLKNNKKDSIEKIEINTISELKKEDIYDFIFVTLHKAQVSSILPILKNNLSPNIIFMVNTCDGYSEWTAALDEKRVLIAFPGAGGRLNDGIVYYEITSKAIQPTTIGEINGSKSPRLKELTQILESSGFPVEISSNMDAWQKTHVAMMCPMINVIYYDGGNNYSVAKNPKAIHQMVLALKEAFGFLKKSGIGIVPSNLSFLLFCPSLILKLLIKFAYNTKWAETVISTPALASPRDYELLSTDFIKLASDKGFNLIEFKKLSLPAQK
jgi:2-dehydropantoate 2-reductase